MSLHEVEKMLAVLENNPAPDRAIPYFNGEDVTGYSWQWGSPTDYISINVRICPDQRVKIGNMVVLHVTPNDISISGSSGGGSIGGNGLHKLSFTVARSKPLSPIEGLESMLREFLKESLSA